MVAKKFVENLGYNKIPSKPLKLISTQEHIKALQQLTPSKASHNKNVTFNIPETHHTKSSKDNETLTESHLIFSVLNCTSFKESFFKEHKLQQHIAVFILKINNFPQTVYKIKYKTFTSHHI